MGESPSTLSRSVNTRRPTNVGYLEDFRLLGNEEPLLWLWKQRLSKDLRRHRFAAGGQGFACQSQDCR
jgi:hypothetical protein